MGYALQKSDDVIALRAIHALGPRTQGRQPDEAPQNPAPQDDKQIRMSSRHSEFPINKLWAPIELYIRLGSHPLLKLSRSIRTNGFDTAVLTLSAGCSAAERWPDIPRD